MLASTAAGGIKTGSRAARLRPRGWVLTATGSCCAAVVAAVVWLGLPGSSVIVPSTSPDIRLPGLLIAGDAGPGWASTTGGALQAEPAGCFRPRARLMATSARSVLGVLINAPAGIPTVDEVAARYASTDRAVAGFDSVAASLRACATFTTAAGTAVVSPLRMSVDGVRSAAARISLGEGAESAGADFVALQRGNAVALIVYGTAGTPDESTVISLAARASERLGP